MESNGSTYGKSIALTKAQLTAFDGTQFDIRNFIRSVQIFEDMFSSFIVAELAMDDANGLIQLAPIIGEETIELQFRGIMQDDDVNLSLCVVKIPERIDYSQGAQLFTLSCVSQSAIANLQTRISQSFQNMTVNQIVTAVLASFNPEEKKALIAETSGLFSYVAPNLLPAQVINNMMLRARHQSFPTGSAFVFYETVDSFVFDSIENLYSQDAKETLKVNVKNLYETNPESERNAINKYVMQNSFNTIDSLQRGVFGNTVGWVDLIAKTFGKNTYNYSSDYEKTKHANRDTVNYGVATSQSKLASSSEQASIKFVTTSAVAATIPYVTSRDNLNLDDRENILQFRSSQMQQLLGHQKLRVEIPGNSDLRTGDMVNVIFPSTHAVGDEQDDISPRTGDKFTSGKYLITAIRHSLIPYYTNVLELCRDGYDADHEKFASQQQRSA